MLVRYKKMYNKIAMGLLSFMPDGKDLQQLQNTIKLYESEEDKQLFFWKEEEGIVGLIGIDCSDEEKFEIQHLCVSPSHRGEGLAKAMIQSLKELYPEVELVSAENITEMIHKSA